MEGSWSCPVALTGGGDIGVLSVTSSAEPSLVFSQLAAARATGPGSLRDTTRSRQPQVGSWRQIGQVRRGDAQPSWQELGAPCPLWGSPVPKQWIFNSATCFPHPSGNSFKPSAELEEPEPSRKQVIISTAQ